MIKLIDILKELKIIVYPGRQGVDVDDTGVETIPVTTLPIESLVLNEPASKMKSPESQATLKQLVTSMKKGKKIPPILVRKLGNKYQILDGHHRYFATKIIGGESMRARIIPPEYIEASQEDYKDS